MPPNNPPSFEEFKNFTQVFLDGELEGSPLEGSDLATNLNYLKEFLTFVLEEKADNPLEQAIIQLALAQDKEKRNHAALSTLATVFDSLIEFQTKIDVLAFGLSLVEKQDLEKVIPPQMEALAESLLKQYQKKGYVFFPGGWAGNPGHQMIYCLCPSPTQKNHLRLLIYNTGSGLEYHQAIALPSAKKKYYPIFGIEFSANDFGNVKPVLIELLKLQIYPRIKYELETVTAKHVYTGILATSILWLNAKIIPAKDLAKPIVGQRSGTCVFKSCMQIPRNDVTFNQITRAKFTTNQAYKQFYFSYRLFLLNKALTYQNIIAMQGLIPDYPKWLDKALGNTSRMLDTTLKPKSAEWGLNENSREILHHAFIEWEAILANHESKPIKRVIYLTESSAEYKHIYTTQLAPPQITEQKQDRYTKRRYDTFHFGKYSFAEDLTACLRSLQFEPDIMQFCLTYTDKNKIILDPNREHQPETILSCMESLLTKYQAMNPQASPQSVIISLALLTIMDRLCEASLWMFESKRLSNSPLYAEKMIGNFVSTLMNNPFLATHNPMLDTLWQHVSTYYKTLNNAIPYENSYNHTLKKWLKHYREIITTAPENEVEAIRSGWETVKKNSQYQKPCSTAALDFGEDYAFCFAYLYSSELFGENRLNNSVTARTPRLNQAFALQKRLEIFNQTCLQKIAFLLTENGYKAEIKVGNEIRLYVPYEYDIYTHSTRRDENGQYILSDKMSLIHPQDLHYGLVLNPSLVHNHFQSWAPFNALTANYDGNACDSNQVLFAHPSTKFNKEKLSYHTKYQERNKPSLYSRLETLLNLIRFSPTTTFTIVLSEFIQHPDWLQTPDLQKYIEMTLFQPDCLLVTLTKNPGCLSILNKLIASTHRHEDASFPDAKEWFALQLATQIANYATRASTAKLITLPDTEQKQCATLQEQCLQAVSLRLTNPRYEKHTRGLWLLKLKTLNSLSAYDAETYAELIKSYFIISQLPEQKDTDPKEAELTQTEIYFAFDRINAHRKLGNINTEAIALCITEGLKQSDPNNLLWQAPWLPTESKTEDDLHFIDNKENTLVLLLAERTILHNDKELAYLPRAILDSKMYRDLLPHTYPLASKCRLQTGEHGYTFTTKQQITYRCFLQNSLLQIQQKRGSHWYTLVAPTDAIAKIKDLNLGAFDKHVSPLLQQAHFHIWVRENTNNDYFIVNTKTQQTVYEHNWLGLHRLIEPKGTVATEGEQLELLLLLESAELIEYIRSDTDNVESWHLPRYGLTVIYDKEQDRYLTADKRYELSAPTDEQDVFGTGLLFIATHPSVKDAYVIPLQRYYFGHDKTGSSKTGAHFYAIHDLTNHLNAHALPPSELNLGWDFTHTERLVYLPMHEGKIETLHARAADQIYLAYLYLMQDKPELSFALLNQCALQDTADEVERLWWIVTQLPASEQVKIVNPSIVAIQLLALYNLLVITDRAPQLATGLAILPAGNDNTQKCINQLRTQLLQFIQRLPTHIVEHYNRYYYGKNNVPIHLHLSPAQEEFMLSTCYHPALSMTPKVYLEAFGARYLSIFGGQETQHTSEYLSASFSSQPSWIQTAKDKGWVESVQQIARRYGAKLPSEEQEGKAAFLSTLSAFNDAEMISTVMGLSRFSPWMKCEAFYSHFFFMLEHVRARTHTVSAVILKTCLCIYNAYESEADKNNLPQESKDRYLLAKLVLYFSSRNIDHLIPSLSELRESKDPLYVLFHNFERMKHEYHVSANNFVAEIIQLEVKPAPAVTQAISRPLENPNTQPDNALFTSTVFETLQSELRHEEKQFLDLQQATITVIRSEPEKQKNLKEQDTWLENLDNQLLKKLNESQANQLAIYANHAKRCQENLPTLHEIERKLEAQQALAAKNIHTLIANRKRHLIQEIGKLQTRPSLLEFANRYASVTITDYENLGIKSEDIRGLQQALADYLNLEDALIRLRLLIKAIEKNKPLLIINALLSKNEALSKQATQFQYMKKIALRPQQAEMLTRILRANDPAQLTSPILQMRPAGGKTNVIAPIMLHMLADGNHLVFGVFPDALLNTNFSYLNLTSKQAFNQDSFIFHFNRHSPSEPRDLQLIYQRFLTAMKYKQYIATTVSSLESLGAKLIEILFSEMNRSSYYASSFDSKKEEQVLILQKILLLFAKNGIIVVDEAHKLLHIMKELNYTLGTARNIDRNIMLTVANLLNWLYQTPLPNQISFAALLQNPALLNEAQRKEYLACATLALIDPATMPIWMEDCLVEDLSYADLENYLLNKTDENQLYGRLKSHPEIQSRLALVRVMLRNFLPYTLTRKLYEHFGEAFDLSKIAYAVPYSANNTPTTFVFAKFIITFLVTGQMYFCKGISQTGFTQALTLWQTRALEKRSQEGNTITRLETLFNNIFPDAGVSLLTLDVHSTALMQTLYQHHETQPDIVAEALVEVLQTVKLDPFMLNWDKINFVGMFPQTFLLSGTPVNFRTMHSNVIMPKETSLLIDSQIKHYLREKNTSILPSAANPLDLSHNAEQLVHQFYALALQVRAFIDCGSQLRGLNNRQMAESLANDPHLPQNIQFILFYQDDFLHAMPTPANKTRHQTIKLTNTDAETIKNELDLCKPRDRITYYDQDHTLGSDIRQAQKSIGVVTVAQTTTISAFIQAVSRMRALDQDQEIIILLEPGLFELLNPSTIVTEDPKERAKQLLDKLFEFLAENLRNELEPEHYEAALKKIRNVYREDLYMRLLHKAKPIEMVTLFKKCSPFFIEEQTDDVMKLFGKSEILTPTSEIFRFFCDKHLKAWKTAVDAKEDKDVASKEKILSDNAETIAKDALLVCKPFHEFSPLDCDKEAELQQETKNETNRETKKETYQFQNVSIQTKKIETYPIKLDFVKELIADPDKAIKRVSEARFPTQPKEWSFSENLHVSSAFQHAYHTYGSDFIHFYTKPALSIFFMLDTSSGTLQALLLAQEEAEVMGVELLNPNSKIRFFCWLSTLIGSPATPEPESVALFKPQQQSFLEQIAFLTGHVECLMAFDEYVWLDREPDSKMHYFKQHISPVMSVSNLQLLRLQNSLFQLKMAHIYQWHYTEEEAKAAHKNRLPVPAILKKRFIKMRPALEKLKTTVWITEAIPEQYELRRLNIHRNDCVLVTTFAEELLKTQTSKSIAEFILRKPKERMLLFILTCFENAGNNGKRCSQIAEAIAAANPAFTWVIELILAFRHLHVDYAEIRTPTMASLTFLFGANLLPTLDLHQFLSVGKQAALQAVLQAAMEGRIWREATIDSTLFCKQSQPVLAHELVDTSLKERLSLDDPTLSDTLIKRKSYLENHHGLTPSTWEKLVDETSWQAIAVLEEEKAESETHISLILQNPLRADSVLLLSRALKPLSNPALTLLLTVEEENLSALNRGLQFLSETRYPLVPVDVAALCMPVCLKSLTMLKTLNINDHTIILDVLSQPNVSLLRNALLLNHLVANNLFHVISDFIQVAPTEDLARFLQLGLLNLKVDKSSLLAKMMEHDSSFLHLLFRRAPIKELIEHFDWKTKITDTEVNSILLERAPLFALEKKLLGEKSSASELQTQITSLLKHPDTAMKEAAEAEILVAYLETHIPYTPDGSTSQWEKIINRSLDAAEKQLKKAQDEHKKESLTPPSKDKNNYWGEVYMIQTQAKYENKMLDLTNKIATLHQVENRLYATKLRLCYDPIKNPKQVKDALKITELSHLALKDVIHIDTLLQRAFVKEEKPEITQCKTKVRQYLAQSLNEKLNAPIFTVKPHVGLWKPLTLTTTEIYLTAFIELHYGTLKKLLIYLSLEDPSLDEAIPKNLNTRFGLDTPDLKQLLQADIAWQFNELDSTMDWTLIEKTFLTTMQQGLLHIKQAANKTETTVALCADLSRQFMELTAMEEKRGQVPPC